jgi:hypothetical protein
MGCMLLPQDYYASERNEDICFNNPPSEHFSDIDVCMESKTDLLRFLFLIDVFVQNSVTVEIVVFVFVCP